MLCFLSFFFFIVYSSCPPLTVSIHFTRWDSIGFKTVLRHLVTATFLWRHTAMNPVPVPEACLLPIRRKGSVFFYCFIPYLCFCLFICFLAAMLGPARRQTGGSQPPSPHNRASPVNLTAEHPESISCQINKQKYISCLGTAALARRRPMAAVTLN